MGQATEAVVVAVSFVAVWAAEDKIFELENFVQQGEKSSPTKLVEEARLARALEYSTYDFEHKEIENVTMTYL